MNIFVLDTNPVLAARYHCDKHVVKMVTETAQMLSTARLEFGLDGPYRKTHTNHPCSKWVRESYANYAWAWHLGYAIGEEYTHRYGKEHKSWLKFAEGELEIPDKTFFNSTEMTPFALAMPDEFKGIDAVEAYRSFYTVEKAHILKYKNREVPHWLNNAEVA